MAEALEESVSPHAAAESSGARLASTYELFFGICKLMVDDGGLSALFALATACRVMSDVALDILWEKQVHLGNLFLTIPRVESSWVIRHHWVNVGGGRFSPREVNKLLLERPEEQRLAVVTEAEYARFRNYAQRIKVLEDYKDKDDAYIIIDEALVYSVLEHGPILPNAHAINFRSSEKFAFEDLRIVLRSDNITEPAVPSCDVWVSLVNRYDQTLGTCASLANIRALTISPGENYEAIPHLRRLPFLEDLHLIRVCSLSFSHPPLTPQPGFRALRSLEISEADQFDYAREVVRFMSSEPLRLHTFKHLDFRIDSSYWGCNTDKQLGARQYYETLRRCLDHDSLTTLHVSTGTAASVRSAYLFANLLVFKNISTAFIYVNHGDADLDSALDIFTAAWPSLTLLRIVNNRPGMNHVTFEGLVPLATRCPALEFLEIPVDTRRPAPKPIDLPEYQALLGRRMALDVQFSTPPRKQEDIDLLVNFLASVFPAQTLRFILASGRPKEDVIDDDEWWQIFDKVWKLCKKRMQSGRY
ncbi:hypothetical protein BD626DRAFT_412652 [Schizophyllum amplum]|uniref:F-box domain-containing protein n=1 Tax=Schizophyllum amplum TaxID=97359 RepID=A0A550BX19_9AGAR|nr:hypothetical protein BD626DRAFT_412652 [Auriculariopsis ampla]